MKKYFRLVAIVIFSVPFIATAKISSLSHYTIPFRMEPLACHASSGNSFRMWSFTQLTELMADGRCLAYAASGAGAMPVNSWRAFLSQIDALDYTVGAGVAACQKAACTLQIGSGAGNATGIAAARAALTTRNAPAAVSLPAPEAIPCFR